MRALLHPPQSEEEIQRRIRHAQIAIYSSYGLLTLAALVIGILLLSAEGLTEFGRVAAWAAIIFGSALILSALILKPQVDCFLASALSQKAN